MPFRTALQGIKVATDLPPVVFSTVDAFVGATHMIQGRTPRLDGYHLQDFPLADAGEAERRGANAFAINMAGRCLLRGRLEQAEVHNDSNALSLSLSGTWEAFERELPSRMAMLFDTRIDPSGYEQALEVPEAAMVVDLDVHVPFIDRVFIQKGVVTSFSYQPPITPNCLSAYAIPVSVSILFWKALFPADHLSTAGVKPVGL